LVSSSRSAVYDESRDLSQKFRPFLEQFKVGNRLVYQQFGLGARPFNAEN
jgi:hypothetical protein